MAGVILIAAISALILLTLFLFAEAGDDEDEEIL